MGKMRQKLLEEYLDTLNTVKALEPDEVHLQGLECSIELLPL